MTLSFTYRVPEILILLDQSVTGNGSDWSALLRALTSVMVDNGIRIDWGLYTFPEGVSACGAGTLTDVIDMPVTPMDYASVAGGVGASQANRRGAPTAAAIAIGAAYLRTIASDAPKFMLLVTDHPPSCAGTIDALTADDSQAQTDAVAAIGAAAADGFPTIVLAPSTAPYVAQLNALAQAGQRPRGPGVMFYTQSTIADLFTTTNATCTFPLSTAPLVPDNVRVSFNDAPVPRDTSHMLGWDYTAPNDMNITFYGDWCTRVLTAPSVKLTILYGCP
jgi:hypothetical protein